MRNEEVSNYLNAAPEDQQKILKELRELIFSVAPNATEQYKWSRPVYGLGKDFCYLKSAKKYITFGFFQFDKIHTNKNLLEGTGMQMRHIKLKKLEDIEKLDVRSMLVEVLE